MRLSAQGLRRCCKCKEVKPVDAFQATLYICKPCAREYQKHRAKRRVLEGKCARCGTPHKEDAIGRWYCPECAKKRSTSKPGSKVGMPCPLCGQPRTNQNYCRDCEALKRRTQRANLRAEVLTAYGGACTCCGETAQPFLAIDHVNGGGAAHRRALGNKPVYVWLKQQGFPEGFRVLCHNCNMGRQLNGGLCPHEITA